MKKKFVIGLLLSIFLASFGLVGSAGATAVSSTITLNTFVGSTLLMGDKALAGVSAVITDTGTATLIGLGDFSLTTFSQPNNPGFIITAPMQVEAFGEQDLKLSFVVTVLPGGAPITDVSLNFVGGVFPTSNPEAAASIVETVWTKNPILGGAFLGYISIGANGTSYTPFGSVSFAPQKSIFVTKDISVNGDASYGGSAFISEITQQFSEVPVPPSLLLFAPGLLGLVGLRKRFFG